MLRFIFCVSFLCSCVGGLLAEDQLASHKNAGLQKPASWQEYRTFLQQHRFIGTWEATGTTKEIFEGIPAGIAYTQTSNSLLTEQGSEMQLSHRMQTTDGEIISKGGGSVSWNKDSGQIEGLFAGFDTGKPYSGKMTLAGIDAESGTERWTYQETSRGKTQDYNIEIKQINANQRKESITLETTGNTIHSELHRKNPVAEYMASFDTTGVWEANLPDGSQWQIHTEWILDGRALRSKNVAIEKNGKATQKNTILFYWDASRKRVTQVGTDITGSSWRGERVSLQVEDDKRISRTRFQGVNAEGVSMGLTMTLTLQGDQLTRVFSEWTFDDGRSVLEQWREPLVFRKLK
ncbi:MAG: hypothetical protein ACR2N1_02010 [Rubripirellula sp.]